MKSLAWIAALAVAVHFGADAQPAPAAGDLDHSTMAAASPALVDPVSVPVALVDRDGRGVAWREVTAGAPQVAVLVWASWAPRADREIARLEAYRRAAAGRQMDLVVIAVQEPLEDSRRVLDRVPVRWYHDRHGALLKAHRIIRVPAVVVMSDAAEVLERPPLDPAALGGPR